MDTSVVVAMSAALGSMIGAGASAVTTWITERKQTMREYTTEILRERESLYGELSQKRRAWLSMHWPIRWNARRR